MKRILFLTLSLLLFGGMYSHVLAQGEGKITITSPKDGETLHASSIVVLEVEVDKGIEGDHIHLYIDGYFEAIVKEESYKMKGLPKGEHSIVVKLATKRHKELGPEDTVKFTIE